MAVITCKMCGGSLILVPGQRVAECDSCGTLQTVPSADSEKKLNLFTRATQLRSACDFDKAAGVYESIVAEFPKEAEAYWGLVLCKYGIEYVDDPATGKKVPTCHRSSFDSVLSDPDLAQALQNADVLSDKLYREEAQQLEQIRRGIVEVSNREEPYDIFICYKETDINGRRTLDSVIAQDIYGILTDKGYRVFFSRVTLRDKLGLEYEPYIFAALNSAKVMLAVGTNMDYYNAVWVKNEWSRYLKLMATDRSKRLFPVYKGIGPYDLPQQMQRLQALNYGELGADQDLLMGIEKVIPRAKPTPVYAPQPAPVYAPQPAPVGGQAEQEAMALIKKGQKLMAIKVIREAYGLGLRDAKDWADAAEQGNVRPLGNTSAPTPAPIQEPGGVEREAVNLVQRGRYKEAIQFLRDRFDWSKSKAEIWVSAVEQAGGVPSAADIARVEAHREAERKRKADHQQSATIANGPKLSPAPQGIDEIAACIRSKQPQQGAELARKYYNLLPDQAENIYKKIEFALLHDQYPAPDAQFRGEKATEIWTEVTKSFLEMQKAVRAVNKHEHSCTEEVNRYNRASTQKDRDYRSGLVDYDKKQIAYEVGRIQYWGKRMDDAAKKLQAEIELQKPKPAAPVPSLLRFDGIYQCKEGQYNSCLRFFTDGVVVSVTTSGTAQQIASWFNHDYENSGKYAISGINISFSCTSQQGTVDYRGFLKEDGMELDIHSHINGYRRKAVYRFVSFTQNPPTGRVFLAVEGNGKQLPPNKGLRYFFIVDGNMQKQILLMADAKTVATSLDLPAGTHTVALQVFGMIPSDLRAEVAPHQIQVTPSGIARVVANRPGIFGKQTLQITYHG